MHELLRSTEAARATRREDRDREVGVQRTRPVAQHPSRTAPLHSLELTRDRERDLLGRLGADVEADRRMDACQQIGVEFASNVAFTLFGHLAMPRIQPNHRL